MAERVLGVYGASGCGRGVMPLVRAASAADPARLTFVDDGAHPSMVNGESCMDYASFRALPGASKSIVLAISDSRIRERLAVRCAADGLGFFEKELELGAIVAHGLEPFGQL